MGTRALNAIDRFRENSSSKECNLKPPTGNNSYRDALLNIAERGSFKFIFYSYLNPKVLARLLPPEDYGS